MRQFLRLSFVLCLLLSQQCAHARLNAPQLIPQRTSTDCTIAALAMLAQTSYERVDLARAYLGIDLDIQGGAPVSDILLMAGQLGIRLIPRVLPTIYPTDRGIAIFTLGHWTHAVYINQGYVYDPLRDVPERWDARYGAEDSPYRLYAFLKQ